jgi:ATP-dependent protease HslVU (ClpYQ) peptidase subunit
MTNIRNALMQAAGSASGDPVYVEDVFSTHLFTGTQSTLAINNGIDLDDKGGLVWFKARNNARNHALFDTERGNNLLYSSTNAAQSATTTAVTATNSNGFTVGSDTQVNKSGETIVAWTFAKQEGFFDVVTYTGDGTSARTVSHNLGCKPGMIIVKRTDSSADWQVWHRYTNLTYSVAHLNTTAAWTNTGGDNAAFADAYGNATNFTLGAGSRLNDTNENSATYVAYLFAGQGDADSQIFGDDGDEAIIKCGSYTGTGNTSLSVNLGFEPQWLLIKASSGGNAASQYWAIYDVMRGWTNVTGSTKYLAPNLSSAEATWWDLQPTSTGFASTADSGTRANESGTTYIYTAIRRGPMKEPDAGTDVLHIAENTTNLQNGTELPATGFPADIQFGSWRDSNYSNYLITRLLGGKNLYTHANDAAAGPLFDFGHKQDVIEVTGNFDGTSSPRAYYSFRRYPKVFDVVVYSGTGSNLDVTHNLKVVPEMQIIKRLDSSSSGDWGVYHKDVPFTGSFNGQYLFLADGSVGVFGSTTIFRATPTASVFKVGTNDMVNNSSGSYLWLGFASLSGISHVGSYTGTGNDINLTDLGAAARFVLIKRADDGVAGAGGWYVFDTTSGIVSGNDPYILWNSTAAEVTNTDYIDPHSSGFTITSSAPAALNASGGKYIYLAFA